MGLFRLNENSSVSFVDPVKTYELRSGAQPELSWELQLVGIEADKVEVILMKEDSEEEIILPCSTDESGRSKIVLPYEFKSEELNQETTEVFGAIVCVDDIPVYYESLGVTCTLIY